MDIPVDLLIKINKILKNVLSLAEKFGHPKTFYIREVYNQLDARLKNNVNSENSP